ncbi:restriction endonuclease subunit S [Rhizobium ruizarguesonis]|uniref:restriction endonuclease subunit S n=1 Tax=Rhizobium ruizarguesonis TaxID=2081791 RepID=UPI00102F78E1|nr:restriction endonuclease subunit S [Rhizobium ruizarguesonis]TBD82041.1 hypothetical protein ELH11_20060 [Rhizobium ruizarguesonis]TBE13199.1 hypothetical protein ELH09_20140 [Rhizobium ruizarguesonis]
MSSEVPDGWRRTTLGEVTSVKARIGWRGLSANEYTDDGPFLIAGKHIKSGVVDWSSCDHLSDFRYEQSPEIQLQAGDVIFSKDGSIGNPTLIESLPGPATINGTMMMVRPNTNFLEPAFLYQVVCGVEFHRMIREKVSGSSIPHIFQRDIVHFPIILPPLDEQRQIAEMLTSVDEAIAATTKTVQAAAVVRQIALDTMIRRVLADPDTEMRPLSYLADVRTGLAKNKNRAGPKVLLPYLRVANVQDGWFDLTDVQDIEVDPAQADRYLLKVGDVLLTEGGDYDKLGRGGVWRGEVTPCLHQNHVFCVRPDPNNLVSGYFALATQSTWGRAYFLSCAKRTTNLASINSSQLKDFPVPVVSVTKQVDLIAEIQGIDAMIDLEKLQLKTLSRLHAELSSDLLSGRVRIPAPAAVTLKSVPSAFKRAVFAAEIVHQLHADNRFGSVKHEKIVHLCELHLGLQADLDRHAYKEAAGPYDPKARRSVERIFQQQKWFDAAKADGKRVIYVPLEKAGGHADYFDRYFGDKKAAIQSIIELLRPLNTEQCEIVATLYAVWNDFLIDKQQPTDDEIVSSVLQWHAKKREIAAERWHAALPWMRQKGLVPKGIGEKTRVAQR